MQMYRGAVIFGTHNRTGLWTCRRWKIYSIRNACKTMVRILESEFAMFAACLRSKCTAVQFFLVPITGPVSEHADDGKFIQTAMLARCWSEYWKVSLLCLLLVWDANVPRYSYFWATITRPVFEVPTMENLFKMRCLHCKVMATDLFFRNASHIFRDDFRVAQPSMTGLEICCNQFVSGSGITF